MNTEFIKCTIGKLFIILSALMLVPLCISFLYREGMTHMLSFIIPIVISFTLGKFLEKRGDNTGDFYLKEAMFIVAMGWIGFSLLGAFPLMLTPMEYPTYIDALFEMVSGFTTTGASVARSVEILPHSIIFWRSMSHLIGGMGILVFTLAILPKTNRHSSLIMQAEVPGPTFGKITSKLSDTARVLYTIYLIMTLITMILLLFGGMDLFDASIYAMSTAATGGFGNRDISIGFYDSRYIEIVLSVAMVAFGVNFNVYYYSIYRSVKEGADSEELRWYLAIVVISTLLIFLNIRTMYDDTSYTFSNSLFAVASVMTTTGFVSADFGTWPLFSRLILILLMFIGGCAGSTAGGLKVSRIIILVKRSFNQIRESQNPKRITINRLDSKKLDEDTEASVSKYFSLYVLLFMIFLFIVALDVDDFQTAFTTVATTINNVGPGIGEFGPIANFAAIGNLSKVALIFAMFIGRLEIFPILLLFTPSTYKNLRGKI
ncbi:MAG: TrkH family potassium uptake protein [Peptoniphilus sp.]|nr:TrkH family potassium uptake protein [Peptoniphilus sp.]MDY6044308.1 TrkH family potassium uptake protein [Peptoniphilus sp.]